MSISFVLSIFFNSIVFRTKSLSILLEIKAQSSMNTDKIKALMYMTKGENETMMEFHLNSMSVSCAESKHKNFSKICMRIYVGKHNI